MQRTFPKPVSDSLRGVMQLVIVCSHLYFAMEYPPLPFVLCNKLGTTVIALFLFMSGYGLAVSLKSKGEAYWKGFFTRRVWGVFSPMLWLTILFQLILWTKHGYTPLLSALIFRGETPLPNAWFIFALVLLYTFFFIAFRLTKRVKQSIVVLAILSLVFIATTYLLHFERAWWVTTLAFLSGVIYAYYEKTLYHAIGSVWGLILSIGITFGIIYSNIELLLLLPYLVIPIVVIVLLNKSGYVQWIQREEGGCIRNILNSLSSISYELYLIHGIAIYFMPSYLGDGILFVLAVICSSITFAYLYHWLLSSRGKKGGSATHS